MPFKCGGCGAIVEYGKHCPNLYSKQDIKDTTSDKAKTEKAQSIGKADVMEPNHAKFIAQHGYLYSEDV